MTAEVSIHVAERRGVLAVPNAALRFAPPTAAFFQPGDPLPEKGARGARTVYLPVAKGSMLKSASVKIGISDGLVTEVLEGLAEGDLVVTAAIPAKAGAVPFAGPPPGGGPPTP
jgi:HlyD family secretion protein